MIKSIISFIKGIIFTIMLLLDIIGIGWAIEKSNNKEIAKLLWNFDGPKETKTEKVDDNKVPMGFKVN